MKNKEVRIILSGTGRGDRYQDGRIPASVRSEGPAPAEKPKCWADPASGG